MKTSESRLTADTRTTYMKPGCRADFVETLHGPVGLQYLGRKKRGVVRCGVTREGLI